MLARRMCKHIRRAANDDHESKIHDIMEMLKKELLQEALMNVLNVKRNIQ